MPLSKFTSALTDPLLDKKGFLSGSIIKDWPVIVGNAYKDTTYPEKVTFPRGEKAGGTLYINTQSSGVSLLLEHAKVRILDSINTYYGYKALKEIRTKVRPRFQEGPLKKLKSLGENEKQAVAKQVSHIKDDDLRAVLRKLGESIALDNK